MSRKKISGGVVHEIPADLKRALASDPQVLTAWEDITPLARNEWICWIESAKKPETRSRRIEWGCSNLKDGLDVPTAKSKMVDGESGSRTGVCQLRGSRVIQD
jgi:uncharacterized protein YdeI (YjbR/CyaY-like superfamily)